MRFSLTSVDETDARRAVARVGPISGQSRRPRAATAQFGGTPSTPRIRQKKPWSMI